jgi:phosphotransferase system HPr (HPr) family protein
VGPTSSETVVRLPQAVALHARPAADFVRAAMSCEAEIVVSADGREANAKSLMAVLALGAKGGTTLALRADGPDADATIERLAECVADFE